MGIRVMLPRDGGGDAGHLGSSDVDWPSAWQGKFLQRPYAAQLLHHAGETPFDVDPLEGVVDHDRTGRLVAGGGSADAPDFVRVHLLRIAIERLEGEGFRCRPAHKTEA